MRIAIITLSLHTNYGGIMQAYALQEVLSRNGHQPIHLQQRHITKSLHPWWLMPLVCIKRIYRKYILHESELCIFEDPRLTIRRNTDKFIKRHLKIRYLTDSEWDCNALSDCDAVLVGSDQIWRPCYSQPIQRAFVGFAVDLSIKRIAYAASFGSSVCEYTPQQISACQSLIDAFDKVTVREQTAVDLCKSMWGVDAELVLDPTLLLNAEDYRLLYDNMNLPDSLGDLFVYVLDKDPILENLIDNFALERRMAVFEVNSKVENENASISDRIHPSVEQWIKAFDDAKFIITDSFHACVFSIIYNKPFICVGNSSRGMARFDSLLSIFDLTHCLQDCRKIKKFYNPQIDWERVNQILQEQRCKSLNILMSSIHES